MPYTTWHTLTASVPTLLPVFAFTPDEGGAFTFACAMHMVEGTLLVRS